MLRYLVFGFAIVMLAGCATHKSPLQGGADGKFIFVTDNEEAVFQAAYDAMLEGNPNIPITELDGPIRGYSMYTKVGLDYWTTMIRVFPAKGTTADSVVYNGYYPEVSGDGSLIIWGPNIDAKVYETVLGELGAVARKQSVVSIERREYLLDRDRWRLNESASLREGGAIKIEGLQQPEGSLTAEDRLNQLESLRSKGLITESEYEEARKAILDDL